MSHTLLYAYYKDNELKYHWIHEVLQPSSPLCYGLSHLCCYITAPSGEHSEPLPFFAGDSLSNAELLEYVENTGPLSSSLSDFDPSTRQQRRLAAALSLQLSSGCTDSEWVHITWSSPTMLCRLYVNIKCMFNCSFAFFTSCLLSQLIISWLHPLCKQRYQLMLLSWNTENLLQLRIQHNYNTNVLAGCSIKCRKGRNQ